MSKKIRVLLADDSALMRRELKRLIEGDPRLEVVASARDGVEAVEQTKALDPDVVALDVNMPRMDGMTALQHIMAEAPRPVVMVSSLTQKGALAAYEALELGAVDFVGKPDGTVSKLLDQITFDLRTKLYNASAANRGNLVRLSRTKRSPRPPKTDYRNSVPHRACRPGLRPRQDRCDRAIDGGARHHHRYHLQIPGGPWRPGDHRSTYAGHVHPVLRAATQRELQYTLLPSKDGSVD